MHQQAFSLRKILVATDFSEAATAALRQAELLAERAGAELTVAHVLTDLAWAVESTSFEAHWRVPPAAIHRAEHRLRHQAEERLTELAAPARAAGRTVHTTVLVGTPFVELIRLVQRDGHDLVVAGTRGLSAVRRILVGSTAERLVRKCPCPVWIVKPGHEGLPRKLLLAVDFSEVSGKAATVATGLAALCQCPLCVLHVLQLPEPSVVLVPEGLPGGDISQQRRAMRRAASKHLSVFVDTHVPAGLTVQSRLVVGTPWRAIPAMARREGADLLVLGSVGRGGVPGFLIGNTAEKVLRRADQALLTVKPDGFISPVQGEAAVA